MDISYQPPGMTPEPQNQTMRLAEIAALLRRHAFLVVLCAALGAAAAYAYARSLPPGFNAYASIAIEGQTFAVPELQGAVRTDNLPDPMPLVRTEVQALMSRQLVQAVIDKLGLDRLPEFNPALRPPSLYGEAKAFVQGLLPGHPARGQQGSEQAVQDEVLRHLVVSQDNRSLVIGIAFTANDPNLAAAVANGFIDQYLATRVERQAHTNENANAEILGRVQSVRDELRRLEAQMRALRTDNELVGLRAGSIGQQQLEELATAAAKASLDRAQIQSQWERASALARQGASADLDSVLSSPTIGKLREQESEASQRLANLSSVHGSGFPAVRSAQAALADARAQIGTETQRIVASLATQLSVARTRESDTQRQLAAAREQGVKVENAQAQLNELQQEAAAQRALYQSLLVGAQHTMAQSSDAGLGLNVRVLSRAVAPVDPSSPNTKLAGGLGLVGGGFAGLLLALLRGNPADRLSAATNRAASAGLPVLATLRGTRSGKALLARTLDNPSGAEAEALRLLRARLRAGGPGSGWHSPARSVLFTALDDDADAACVAAAFAYLAARDGEAAVLVEANLATPRLSALLGTADASYLPALEGGAGWQEALMSDGQAKVDFLLQGRPAAASAGALGGARFQNMLADLHGAYDLTVLSGPRETETSALSLAGEADATVLVVRTERAELPVLQRAAARLSGPARGRLGALMTLAGGRA